MMKKKLRQRHYQKCESCKTGNVEFGGLIACSKEFHTIILNEARETKEKIKLIGKPEKEGEPVNQERLESKRKRTKAFNDVYSQHELNPNIIMTNGCPKYEQLDE